MYYNYGFNTWETSGRTFSNGWFARISIHFIITEKERKPFLDGSKKIINHEIPLGKRYPYFYMYFSQKIDLNELNNFREISKLYRNETVFNK